MVLEIQVRGAEKLRLMADALRKADREDLRRGLDRAIRRAAKPTVADIRDSAANISTRGVARPGAKHPFRGPSTPKGLRRKIAAAVTADVSTAGENARVSFRVRTSRLAPGIQVMPRKFDEGGTFRHPVMGNRDVWVDQTGDPWFWPPIRDHLGTFRAEIDVALDDVRTKIEGS